MYAIKSIINKKKKKRNHNSENNLENKRKHKKVKKLYLFQCGSSSDFHRSKIFTTKHLDSQTREF